MDQLQEIISDGLKKALSRQELRALSKPQQLKLGELIEKEINRRGEEAITPARLRGLYETTIRVLPLEVSNMVEQLDNPKGSA